LDFRCPVFRDSASLAACSLSGRQQVAIDQHGGVRLEPRSAPSFHRARDGPPADPRSCPSGLIRTTPPSAVTQTPSVAHYFWMDVVSLWKDLAIGFLIAGVPAA
jgi:hypothetical protein